MDKHKYGVHQTHCCVLHGCKYGQDDDCPVVNKIIEQEYPCEDCNSQGIQTMASIKKVLSGEQQVCSHCGHTAITGYVQMPVKLTAENGAKAALMGEFAVNNHLVCPKCNGDDCVCEYCNGTGKVIQKINIPWIVIKDIYAQAVKLLGA